MVQYGKGFLIGFNDHVISHDLTSVFKGASVHCTRSYNRLCARRKVPELGNHIPESVITALRDNLSTIPLLPFRWSKCFAPC